MGRRKIVCFILSFFICLLAYADSDMEIFTPDTDTDRFESTAPAKTTTSGSKGDYAVDDSYIYIHTGTQWERAAIATWAVAANNIISPASNQILTPASNTLQSE